MRTFASALLLCCPLIGSGANAAPAAQLPPGLASLPALPTSVETFDDGRRPVAELFAAWQRLLGQGWQLDLIAWSQPIGTKTALPIIALRSPHKGPALWIMTGVHGEEPAGPNAVAVAIDAIAALAERYPVVLLPLLNPHGYARNWRYLNVPIYAESIEGQSVGDSSHLLPEANAPGRARAVVSSMEADAITKYVLATAHRYPPRYSIDLHEDNLINAGYVYSQGEAGAADPLAAEAVLVLRQNNINIKMSGQTRFNEDIINGIIAPVTDSSIDELMSSKTLIVDGRTEAGPAAKTVLVFETPAGNLSLAQRVDAHVALIRRLTLLIADDEVR